MLLRPPTLRLAGRLLFASLLAAAAVPAAGDRMPGAPLPDSEAQQTEPKSLRLEQVTSSVALRIDLPPASVPAVQDKGRGPLRIGIHRDLPTAYRGNLLSRLDWMPVDKGARAAAVLVHSPQATSIRVAVQGELPPGAELRFFHPDGNGKALAVITPADLKAAAAQAEVYWSPSAVGDVIGIEITLPSRAPVDAAWLRVETVAHRFLDPHAKSFKTLDCPELHVDVQCRVGEFPSGLENAVARIDFETEQGSALCTGTLLNDGDQDTFIPYFLTANHCVATAEEAGTVQATWFHQLASCGAETSDIRVATTAGGAELVATSAEHDSTLLKLRRRLPAGVYLAGWDAEVAAADDAVVAIHHPAGEVKKYSAGDVAGKGGSDSVAGAIEVAWEEGVTEGGSSGSAIFRDGFVIGALSHGPVCTTGDYRDYYGAFADLYPRVCSALNPGAGCGDGEHDLPSTARAIPAGGTVAAALDEAGDIDYWRVAIPSYGTLIAETTGDADTVGALEDEQGRALATDDDSGAGSNFRIERNVEPGTYYIRVAGTEDGVGDYVLRVAHTPLPIGALPAVAWDEEMAGELAAPRQTDRWRLEVEAEVAIALSTTGRVDTVGVLRDAAGQTLAENDDGGPGLNFRIDTFLGAGSYLLQVTGYQGETGEYALHASQTPLSELPAIAEDGSDGEVDAPAESHYWRWDVTTLGVSTIETTGSTDTVGRLHTAAGEQTAFNDDGGEGRNFRIERILAPGTYYARIGAYGDETGSYTVTASHLALPAADILELDGAGRGTGDTSGETDVWRFELRQAQIVTVETTGSVDTFGVLEDGFGRAHTDDDSGEGDNFRIIAALAAGTHYVRVDTNSAATGRYALRVEANMDVGDTPAAAAALPIGTLRDGVLRAVGDVDYWRVEVPSAGTLAVASEGTTDTLGALQDASGRTLAEDNSGSDIFNFRIEHEVFPGTYLVRVAGYGSSVGRYALRAAHTRKPLSIPWFLAADNAARGRQGFVRLINHSEQDGTVRIHAIDDAGTAAGSIVVALRAGETVHFNSDDLEGGNPAKGIAAGVGAGVGDWRLQLETELDLNALAYVRTSQGFLTNMHDLVPGRTPLGSASNHRYTVPIFNPASNRRQVSNLRLFNLGEEQASVVITGIDDEGEPAPGTVRLALAPAAARMLTAADLERGGEGIDGSLGDGRGKWELAIGSTEPLGVMNVLETRPAAGEAVGGNLTNLSTASGPPATAPGAQPCAPCEVPLFIAADDAVRQGFVRLSNHAAASGSVEIHAVDDAGRRFGPVTIALAAGATVHFNSDDLEQGNAAKGLSGGVGNGIGDWRLEVWTDLDVVGPLAYARTRDGFLTSLHDLVRGRGGEQPRYRVPVFNPASNRNQRSQLRLVNPTPRDAAVTIAGIDDRGRPGPLGEVSLMLPAGRSRTVDAQQLETGHRDLTGRLGDGTGKWQLLIAADQPLQVLNLLASASGELTNLSSSPQR